MLALEVILKKEERHSRKRKQYGQSTKKSESCLFLSTTNVLVCLEHSSEAVEETEQESKELYIMMDLVCEAKDFGL